VHVESVQHATCTAHTTRLQHDEDNLDVVMAKAAVSGATSGLNSFLLNPDRLRVGE
jgi:hypothetical protein